MVRLGEFFPEALSSPASEAPLTEKFDIFKGEYGEAGIITRLRSVGIARKCAGQHTYTIRLKTFLNDEFYLLPERRELGGRADFTILTRERSTQPKRLYFWHKVGEAVFLPPPHGDTLHLSWDLLGAADVYLRLVPMATNARAAPPLDCPA